MSYPEENVRSQTNDALIVNTSYLHMHIFLFEV